MGDPYIYIYVYSIRYYWPILSRKPPFASPSWANSLVTKAMMAMAPLCCDIEVLLHGFRGTWDGTWFWDTTWHDPKIGRLAYAFSMVGQCVTEKTQTGFGHRVEVLEQGQRAILPTYPTRQRSESFLGRNCRISNTKWQPLSHSVRSRHMTIDIDVAQQWWKMMKTLTYYYTAQINTDTLLVFFSHAILWKGLNYCTQCFFCSYNCLVFDCRSKLHFDALQAISFCCMNIRKEVGPSQEPCLFCDGPRCWVWADARYRTQSHVVMFSPHWGTGASEKVYKGMREPVGK